MGIRFEDFEPFSRPQHKCKTETKPKDEKFPLVSFYVKHYGLKSERYENPDCENYNDLVRIYKDVDKNGGRDQDKLFELKQKVAKFSRDTFAKKLAKAFINKHGADIKPKFEPYSLLKRLKIKDDQIISPLLMQLIIKVAIKYVGSTNNIILTLFNSELYKLDKIPKCDVTPEISYHLGKAIKYDKNKSLPDTEEFYKNALEAAKKGESFGKPESPLAQTKFKFLG